MRPIVQLSLLLVSLLFLSGCHSVHTLREAGWNAEGIGWLYYLSNDFTACITSYQMALRMDSNNLIARYNIALSYLRLGTIEEARQQYSNTLAYAQVNTRATDSIRTSKKPLFTPYVEKTRKGAINDLQSLLRRNICTEGARHILREIFWKEVDGE